MLVYDATCRHHVVPKPFRPGAWRSPLGLSHAWGLGGWLYRSVLRRIDHVQPVTTWDEAVAWLATIEPDRQLDEIQFWGHGKWGAAMVAGRRLDATALVAGHPHHDALRQVRDRMSGPEALWWFRTCETFGALPGQDFARDWTDFFGCRAAGHTFVIGPWQSGLHSLEPGDTPHWDPEEGLRGGTVEKPLLAYGSGPRQPHTIHCLQGTIPNGW